MYSVLIVDDEKYVRLWIKNCINWSEYGFKISGEAANGFEALQKIKEIKPRLVISDMDMPELDGAELIENANKIYPDTVFIILSGYKEFEYMRSAVKNNAVDYLLKPVKAEEIISVLQVVTSKLKIMDKKNEERQKIKMIAKENFDLHKEKLFSSLLNGQIANSQEVCDKLGKFDIQIDREFFSVISLNIDEDCQNRRAENNMDTNMCVFSIINILEESFSQAGIQSYFINEKDEVIGIFNFDAHGEEFPQSIVNVCKHALDKIIKLLNIDVSIGVGSIVNDIMCIEASYKEAKKSLELRLLYGSNHVLTFLSTPENAHVEILDFLSDSCFMNAMASLNYEGCKEIITKTFDRIKELDMPGIDTIKMIYYRLISIILKVIYDKGIVPSCMNIEEIEIFTAISSLSSIDHIKEKLLYYVQKVINTVSTKQNITNSAVEKAKAYIIKHLHEDISLTSISKHVHITPNYFCTLFKAETKQKLFDYITYLRIEKAKILMKDKRLKTYKIGEMVGYKEPKYFCRVFKKITGRSPSNFRKNC